MKIEGKNLGVFGWLGEEVADLKVSLLAKFGDGSATGDEDGVVTSFGKGHRCEAGGFGFEECEVEFVFFNNGGEFFTASIGMIKEVGCGLSVDTSEVGTDKVSFCGDYDCGSGVGPAEAPDNDGAFRELLAEGEAVLLPFSAASCYQ